VWVRGVNIPLPPYPILPYPFFTHIRISLSNNIHLYVADHICIYLYYYLPIYLSNYLLISLSIEIYRYGVQVFPVSYTHCVYTYIRTTYVIRTYARFSTTHLLVGWFHVLLSHNIVLIQYPGLIIFTHT